MSNPRMATALFCSVLFLLACCLSGFCIHSRQQAYRDRIRDLERSLEKYRSAERANLENIDRRVPIEEFGDVAKNEYFLAYRFNRRCCGDCIHTGVNTIKKVFGPKGRENLLLFGDEEYRIAYNGKRSLMLDKVLPNLDSQAAPYFILFGRDRAVRYVLIQPDNDENRIRDFLLAVDRNFLRNKRPLAGVTK